MKKNVLLNKLLLSGSMLSLAIPVEVAAKEANQQRPNVLILLVDDGGYNDFGFNGSKEMETPNIDNLSRQGVVFTDGHVAATVSSPSRAFMLTGRYGQRYGYECNLNSDTDGLDVNEETIADVFKANGYRTGVIGKWHIGDVDGMRPNQRGFDYFYGMLAGNRHYFYDETTSDKPGDKRNILLNGKQVKFDGYLTDVFSDKAIDFMDSSEEPFMLYLSYNAVHTPMQAKKEDLERYKSHPRQMLAAMTYALDKGIGSVIDYLKSSGKYDNTLIFFLSDNGGATTNQSSNYPLKGFKGNKFEGGHRVPFFMVWQNGFKGGWNYDGLVSSLDIFATSIDAAGITKTKNKLDGVSLLPYLAGHKKGEPHESLCWRKMDTKAIRQGDYKLIITQGVDSVLYNVTEDIDEMNNLLPTHPKLYKKLAKNLAKWEKKVCEQPRWIEEGWGDITNGIHRGLMRNEMKTAKDLKKHN